VISFSVGADDAVFVYLDGTIVCDLGGAHASTSVTCSSPEVNAGIHTLDLFYVDLRQTNAALNFAVATQNVTVTPVCGGPPTSSTPILFAGNDTPYKVAGIGALCGAQLQGRVQTGRRQ
jgi:fibro-slime domain-containing protein